MNMKMKGRKIIRWLPNLLLVVLAVSMVILQFPNELEVLAEDTFYQKPDAIPNQIKIIAIDETTLAKLGPYSDWDRAYFADLINLLNANPNAKPRVIGMDVIFTGTGNPESDRKLVEAVENAGNVILASKLEMNSRVVYSEAEQDYAYQYYIMDEITAFEELNCVSDSGFTNMIFDNDGYVRRAYTYIRSEDEIYKSFDFQIAEKLSEKPDFLYDNPEIVEFSYTGKPGDFENIPMSDVLDGTVPASYFADSIVLIGAYEEGLLDAYHVPIDHSSVMYGVECHANAIWALMKEKQMHSVPVWIEVLLTALVVAGYGIMMRKSRLRVCLLTLLGVAVIYPLSAFALFQMSHYKLSLIYIPIGLIFVFLCSLLIRYVELQRKRTEEMQKMLFSMADSMAEAIEGRTPYNANHTKNVARRCMEMMDYINQMHKEKRTELYFSEKDKNQLYLAAMLHDIGKMDIPLEVMDKPTKLGHLEEPLRARLEKIVLLIKMDALTGSISKEESENKIGQIAQFSEKLNSFNCGRPLAEDEWKLIDEIGAQVYQFKNGDTIPYLTDEELDDLHIKAGTLSEKERKIMQSHVVYTDKVLNHIYFGRDYKDVRTIAANHHELLNKKGYPKGIGAEQLDVMTRILTIMDIYDSLIADDRPYKKPKPVDVAFEILDEEAEAGKIDKEILDIAKEIWLNHN